VTNTPKTYQAIMVSSTFTDLKEHRAEVIAVIHNLGFHANVMEYSGAAIGPDVLGKSLAMVAESAAYILLVGHRYGQSPSDPHRNPDKLSITELEFNHAIALGRPILLFVIDDAHLVVKGSLETEPEKAAKLSAFIARAKLQDPRDPDCRIERVWQTFSSKEELALRNRHRHRAYVSRTQ
jgi:hypothetical protein